MTIVELIKDDSVSDKNITVQVRRRYLIWGYFDKWLVLQVGIANPVYRGDSEEEAVAALMKGGE